MMPTATGIPSVSRRCCMPNWKGRSLLISVWPTALFSWEGFAHGYAGDRGTEKILFLGFQPGPLGEPKNSQTLNEDSAEDDHRRRFNLGALNISGDFLLAV